MFENNPFRLCFIQNNITSMCCVLFFYLFYLFECIVIRVGDGGFNTESGFDFVKFEDSSSGSGIFIIYKLK